MKTIDLRPKKETFVVDYEIKADAYASIILFPLIRMIDMTDGVKNIAQRMMIMNGLSMNMDEKSLFIQLRISSRHLRTEDLLGCGGSFAFRGQSFNIFPKGWHWVPYATLSSANETNKFRLILPATGKNDKNNQMTFELRLDVMPCQIEEYGIQTFQEAIKKCKELTEFIQK